MCDLTTKQKYYLKNRDSIIARRMLRYEAKKAEEQAYNRVYQSINRERLREKKKVWTETNKAKINLWRRNKLASDPQARLAANLRNRLNQAVKVKVKSGSAVSDLGCTIEEFKTYIENKFTSGMSWDNYGKWHLDHIKPLASFDLTDRQQFLIACHFTNYQPLWAVDNLKKGVQHC